MYHEFFAGSRLLEWPIIALGIFFSVFVVAVIYAVIGLRGSTKVKELSRLPFDGENEIRKEEARS